jgi:hypothetical protein
MEEPQWAVFSVSPHTNLPAVHRGPGLKNAVKSHPALSLSQEGGTGGTTRNLLLGLVGFWPLQHLSSLCGWLFVLSMFSHILMLLEQSKILQQFPYDLIFLLDKQNIPKILLTSNCSCVHMEKPKLQFSLTWSVTFKEIITVKFFHKYSYPTGLWS